MSAPYRGKQGDLPYEMVTHGSGGFKELEHLSSAPSGFARIHCRDCGAHAERKLVRGMVPEMIFKHFKNDLHWDPISAQFWRCPACIQSRRHSAKGESPNKARVAIAPTVELPKVKLRDIAQSLDVFYDIKRSRWLLGMTEEGIAELHGVPVDDVRRVRRMARERLMEEDSLDRELAAIRALVDSLKLKMTVQVEAYAQMESELSEASSRCLFLERQQTAVGAPPK